MTLDDNALVRLSNPISGRFYRLFVGGQERFIDYALYEAGEPVEFPSETKTTALITFGNAPISVSVADGSGYSNNAGSFNIVSPSGTTWVRYTSRSGNTFLGVTKVFGANSHQAGATINLWADITNRLINVQGLETDTNTEEDWTWRISGNNYNSDLMPEDCSILLLETVSPEGDYAQWDSFKMRALGYVRVWQSQGDADLIRAWSATVESINTYLKQKQGAGQAFGRRNLAEGQPVTASDHLANPLDLVGLDQEEWLGAIGTTEADKVTNSLIDDGPYVSQIQPSQTPETQADTDHLVIQEVFLGDDDNPNLKWFQLLLPQGSPSYTPTGVDLEQMFITNKQTVFIPSNNNPFPVGHPCAGNPHPAEIKGFTGNANYIALRGLNISEDTDRIIFTNNKTAFLNRWNVSSAIPVYDWTEMPGYGDNGLSASAFTLATNDWLQLRGYVQNGGNPQSVFDMVVWGTHVGTPYWNNTGDACDNGDQWDGDGVISPSSGDSIRRLVVANDATNSALDWDIEKNPNPADRRDDTDPVFIAVELPFISTALSANISSGSPTVDQEFPLIAPDDLRLEATAIYLDIRVDSEEIRLRPQTDSNGILTGRWKVGARAINGTVADNHDADTPIFYQHSVQGFTRLSNPESVELRRWARYDRQIIYIGGQPIARLSPRVPQVYEIWGSVEASPKYVGEENYQEDWVGGKPLVTTETGKDGLLEDGDFQSGFVQLKRIPIQPLRHIMLVIKRMNIDSTYAMLNELRVWRAGLSGTTSQYAGIGNVVYHYLRQLLPPERIIIDDNVFDSVGGDVVITQGTLGRILNDLAATYGFKIQYTRDGKIRIKRNPYHPLAVRPPIKAILGGRAIRATLSPQTATRPSRVGAGQVVVRIHDTENLRVFQGVYPPKATFGDVKPLELKMSSGDTETATRIAQMYYLADPLISRQLELLTVGPFPEVAVGDRLLVRDITDDAAYFGRYVDCRVTGVIHNEEGAERLSLQEWRQA